MLHDRNIPRSKANIDHIAIGPGGVFVIETKKYTGEVTVRGDDLFVTGGKRTPIIEQTWREAVNVQAVLAEHMARLGLDCGAGAMHSRLRGAVEDGSRRAVRRAAGVKKLIRNAKRVLSEDEVRNLAEIAERGLRESP